MRFILFLVFSSFSFLQVLAAVASDEQDFVSVEIPVVLEMASKVFKVEIEDKEAVLSSAKINQEDVKRAEALSDFVVSEAYVELSSEELLPASSPVSLTYTEGGRPLESTDNTEITAKLSKALKPSLSQDLRTKFISFDVGVDSDEIATLYLYIVYPIGPDINRMKMALPYIRYDGSKDEIRRAERYGRTAKVVGFLHLKNESPNQTSVLFQVAGELFEEKELRLESLAFSSALEDHVAADLYVDLVWQFAKNAVPDSKLRPQFKEVATQLYGRAQTLDSIEKKARVISGTEDGISIEAQLRPEFQLKLDSGFEVEGQNLVQHSNKARLRSDRQQVQLLGIRLLTNDSSVNRLVSAFVVQYEKNVPADDHECAPMVAPLPMFGSIDEVGNIWLSRLRKPESWSWWTWEFARFYNSTRPSHILSWTFDSTSTDRFETQKTIVSGTKAFINTMTEFKEIRLKP